MLSMCGHVMALPCFTLALDIAISTEQFVLVGHLKCEKRVETFPITKKAVAKVSANGVQ